jgi:hypothetical protein
VGRTLGTVSGGGLLTALAATGWLGALVLVCATFVVAGAVCWIVGDDGRAKRSALLIKTWRGTRRATGQRGRR